MAGSTTNTCDEVPGAERRLSLVVVRTESPAMNPPAGRVAVRVAAGLPGVRVAVGAAGVLVGVGLGVGFKYSPAIQPDPSAGTVTGTQVCPPAAVDGPVTCTITPLSTTPMLVDAVVGPVRRLTRVVARRVEPVG